MRTSLRRALPGLEPGLRILAEGLPAQSGAIDLLGIDAEGRLVLVFIERSEGGADERGALVFARALGTRGWVRSEMPGWLQLVPDLEITHRTETRCLLLVRELSPALRSAIDALPPGWIEPIVYRPFSHRGDEFLLLEQVLAGPLERQVDDSPVPAPSGGPSTEPGPALPALRSGLSEADFRQVGRSVGARRTDERPRPRFDSARD